jgi:two-component system, cell cycle sensor histidine kinase and response regulator CckA
MVADALATVLIVEDDPGIAELERDRLEDAGYRVVVAGDADEAADRLRDEPVDLVLLDYRLPGGVDGLEFYARLRAAGFDPPVILVTGFSDEGTVIRALRAGVRDFVTKSVEYLDYLPEAVWRVLGQVRTERRLVESEARFRDLADNAPMLVWLAGPDGQCTYFNRVWLAFTGQRLDEALGDGWADSVHPDDRATVLDDYRAAVAARRPVTIE